VITCTQDVAATLGAAIAHRIGASRYQLWFDRHTSFHREADRLIVGVPNRHFQEWLERKFATQVAAATAEVFGETLQVVFRIDSRLFQQARELEQRPSPQPVVNAPPPETIRPSVAETASERSSAASRRRWRRLGDFIVGACNRVAYASAISIVENPGQASNPLVLYGTVGTGKTHLLEGIYAGLRKSYPDWVVRYLNAEEFTNRFVQAMRQDRLAAFRRQFRECDVLLLDDLHFLASKKATQEEFLRTFDALLAEGRQVVVTCDCHPRLSEDFTPELVDRLLGGAVWSLSPPDPQTRLAILRARASTGGGPAIPETVLTFLADQLRGNVRELEGAIHSIRHYSRVTNRPVDLPLVREALGELLRHAIRVVQVSDIDQGVCQVLRLEPGTLQSSSRAWSVSHPRMVAMFLARKHTAASHADIGKHFGDRNHSTVVAAEKKVRQWLQDNKELALGGRRVRIRELVERVEREVLR